MNEVKLAHELYVFDAVLNSVWYEIVNKCSQLLRSNRNNHDGGFANKKCPFIVRILQ